MSNVFLMTRDPPSCMYVCMNIVKRLTCFCHKRFAVNEKILQQPSLDMLTCECRVLSILSFSPWFPAEKCPSRQYARAHFLLAHWGASITSWKLTSANYVCKYLCARVRVQHTKKTPQTLRFWIDVKKRSRLGCGQKKDVRCLKVNSTRKTYTTNANYANRSRLGWRQKQIMRM